MEDGSSGERLWVVAWAGPPGDVKDGIGRAVVEGEAGAVNPAGVGTKVAARYELAVGAGETGHLNAEDDPDMVEAHLRDQALETGARFRTPAGLAEIVVDHQHPLR